MFVVARTQRIEFRTVAGRCVHARCTESRLVVVVDASDYACMVVLRERDEGGGGHAHDGRWHMHASIVFEKGEGVIEMHASSCVRRRRRR